MRELIPPHKRTVELTFEIFKAAGGRFYVFYFVQKYGKINILLMYNIKF